MSSVQKTVQEILNGVYDTTGTPALNVTLVEGAVSISAVTAPLSADSSSVSAIQGSANLLRLSGFSNDASTLRVSSFSNDASTARVSAFEGGYSYNNIATSAQTVVKSGAGILGGVSINVISLTSAVRLYDNTVSGGTVIATFSAGLSAGFYPFVARFGTGLVVSSGAGADNLTIMFN